jgi:hypothetical protein
MLLAANYHGCTSLETELVKGLMAAVGEFTVTLTFKRRTFETEVA